MRANRAGGAHCASECVVIRRILVLLLMGLAIGLHACHNDREIIDKHERILADEDE